MPENSFLIPIKDRIRSAFLESIPEKRDLIERLLQKLDNVDIDDRSDSFGCYPNYGIITGSWWALETLWCCSFAVATFGPHLEKAIEKHQQHVYFRKDDPFGIIAIGLLNWSFSVIETKKRRPWLHSNVPWPCLDDGTPTYEGEDLEQTEPIFIGAVGWILLHELAHIHHGHEGREGSLNEEREADQSATEWVFGDAPFGAAGGRAEALVAALFYMTVRETLEGADSDHPPMCERISQCFNFADLHNNAWPLCLMATLIDMLLQWSGKRDERDRKTESTCQSYLEEVLLALQKVRPAQKLAN